MGGEGEICTKVVATNIHYVVVVVVALIVSIDIVVKWEIRV